jgi:hypothetical protein
MGVYQGEGEDRVHQYIASLPHWAAGASVRAAASLAPVRVAAGTGSSDIGINRDLQLPDGRIVVGCNPDGFCDRDVVVLRIDREDGQPLACVVNYACHPTVLGPGNKLTSPDYPGHTRRNALGTGSGACLVRPGDAAPGAAVAQRDSFRRAAGRV